MASDAALNEDRLDDEGGAGDASDGAAPDAAEAPARDDAPGRDLLDWAEAGDPTASPPFDPAEADPENLPDSDDLPDAPDDPLTLTGGAGDDILSGGAGDDDLQGGDGADTLWGGAGDDSLAGHEGDDRLDGAEGDDSLLGGGGNDSLAAGAGDDALNGGYGNDLLQGGEGTDTLDGGTGDDSLQGGAGADFLNGGTGDDALSLGAGDTGHGDAGADLFELTDVLPGDAPARIVDYTPGEDVLAVLYDPDLHPDPQLTVQQTDSGSLILLDGVALAEVAGTTTLTAAQLALVPVLPQAA
ncbi:MAG: hypothetical protein IE927_05405 [Rhodobacterales bacterium]|nr:hypothetical protein [Rhodobacterales bacterium]